jgi:hypothetical protein
MNVQSVSGEHTLKPTEKKGLSTKTGPLVNYELQVSYTANNKMSVQPEMECKNPPPPANYILILSQRKELVERPRCRWTDLLILGTCFEAPSAYEGKRRKMN